MKPLFDFEKDVYSFMDEFRNENFAREFYAALSNMRWKKKGFDMEGPHAYSDLEARQLGILISFSWRSAGGFVSEVRNYYFEMNPKVAGEIICENCQEKYKEHENDKCPHKESYMFPAIGHEQYLDFYCAGNEGSVSSAVEKNLKEKGWEPYPYPPEHY